MTKDDLLNRKGMIENQIATLQAHGEQYVLNLNNQLAEGRGRLAMLNDLIVEIEPAVDAEVSQPGTAPDPDLAH